MTDKKLEAYTKAQDAWSNASFRVIKARVALGKHIRTLRLAKGLKANAVAKKMSVSAPYLYDLELGRRSASNRFYSELFKVLNGTQEDEPEDLVIDGWRAPAQYGRDMHPGRFVEAICPHGIGHHKGTHGCDGCCSNPPKELWKLVSKD